MQNVFAFFIGGEYGIRTLFSKFELFSYFFFAVSGIKAINSDHLRYIASDVMAQSCLNWLPVNNYTCQGKICQCD